MLHGHLCPRHRPQLTFNTGTSLRTTDLFTKSRSFQALQASIVRVQPRFRVSLKPAAISFLNILLNISAVCPCSSFPFQVHATCRAAVAGLLFSFRLNPIHSQSSLHIACFTIPDMLTIFDDDVRTFNSLPD